MRFQSASSQPPPGAPTTRALKRRVFGPAVFLFPPVRSLLAADRVYPRACVARCQAVIRIRVKTHDSKSAERSLKLTIFHMHGARSRRVTHVGLTARREARAIGRPLWAPRSLPDRLGLSQFVGNIEMASSILSFRGHPGPVLRPPAPPGGHHRTGETLIYS